MRDYSKAYLLAELRRFPGWTADAAPADADLSDEDVGYLGDDLVVLSDPIREEGVLFFADTPEWREFCTSVLRFEVPADLVRTPSESQQS